MPWSLFVPLVWLVEVEAAWLSMSSSSEVSYEYDGRRVWIPVVCGVILEQLERRVELWVKDKNKKSANCHEKIFPDPTILWTVFILASFILPNGTTIFNPHAVF
jgi:hypothetical protein